MNNVTVFCLCAMFVLSVVLYCVYRGVYGSLSHAYVGEVYNFRYLQPMTGNYERYLAKVISVRDMKNDIGRLNMTSDYRFYDRNFVRTPTLVTCQLANGDIRNFYAERIENCRRSLFGRFLYSSGVAFMF